MKKIFIVILVAFFCGLRAQTPGVSIGLENNQDPQATLDINGNLIVEYPEESKNGDYPLFRGDNNRVVKGESNNQRFIYTLQYRIKTADKGDWIESYHTKIPTNKYFAFVTSATIYSKKTNKPAFIGHNVNWKYRGDNIETNPIKQVYLDKGESEWILKADFPGAGLADVDSSEGFYWKVSIMIIDNNYINYVSNDDTTKITLGDDGTGSAESSPIGNYQGVYKEIEKDNDTFKSKGIVGVNTEKGSEPEAELDVNGDMIIRTVNEVDDIRDVAPLLWNPETKRLTAIPKNEKPFVFLHGNVNCKSAEPGAEDWIEEFDTGIPVDSHILISTDAVLGNYRYNEKKSNTDNSTYGYIFGIAHKAVGDEIYNTQDQIEVFSGNKKFNEENGVYQEDGVKQEETWRLRADYFSGDPVCGYVNKISGIFQFEYDRKKNPSDRYNNTNEDIELCKKKYYWEFRLMAISTSYAADLGVFEDTMSEVNQNAPTGVSGDDFIEFLKKRKSN